MTPAHCVDCHRPLRTWYDPDKTKAPHKGRGLCSRCHLKHTKAGTLIDFERMTRPLDVTLEEARMLFGEGYSTAQVAARLGVTENALRDVLRRAKQHAPTG